MSGFRLSLTQEDRARYGLPEWICYDPTRPLLSEIRALQEQAQIGLSRLHQMLWGAAAADPDAEPDQPDPDDRLAALGLVCWLAVRRHQPDLTWSAFDVDLLGVHYGSGGDDPNREAPDGA